MADDGIRCANCLRFDEENCFCGIRGSYVIPNMRRSSCRHYADANLIKPLTPAKKRKLDRERQLASVEDDETSPTLDETI